jgi:hypothetical protein
MAHKTPLIRQQTLFLPDQLAPLCSVGSIQWFEWLQTATSFRFASTQRRSIIHGHGPLLPPISLRKERRRQRDFWYAYRREYGQLCKCYAGRSAQLTLARLNELADHLYDCR